MHHFFVSPDQINGDEVQIIGSDVNHIRNVLRMKNGDELLIRTGEDLFLYRCVIKEITDDCVKTGILEKKEEQAELPCEITLYQCLPKSDKMEFIIQKAVELGAAAIVPVASRRCITKLEKTKAENKVRRWNAVSESAAKQSGRAAVPEVMMPLPFEQAVSSAARKDLFLLPYERAVGMDFTRQVLNGIRPGQTISILIGPEGGFDQEEADLAVKAGAKEITLGQRILRTETAGMALLAALMMLLDQG